MIFTTETLRALRKIEIKYEEDREHKRFHYVLFSEKTEDSLPCFLCFLLFFISVNLRVFRASVFRQKFTRETLRALRNTELIYHRKYREHKRFHYVLFQRKQRILTSAFSVFFYFFISVNLRVLRASVVNFTRSLLRLQNESLPDHPLLN
jgi:hypothetical protein